MNYDAPPKGSQTRIGILEVAPALRRSTQLPCLNGIGILEVAPALRRSTQLPIPINMTE